MRETVKYLVTRLNGRLDFSAQIVGLAPRVEGLVAQLDRILPNLSVPEYRVRRLCTNVIQLMVLYEHRIGLAA